MSATDKMQADISEVENRIALIESVLDELATLPHCSKWEVEKTIADVMQTLSEWNEPGADSVRAAYHFKCIAFHVLSLIHCGSAQYDFLKYADRNLEWSISYLMDERDGLEALFEIQNMGQ